MAVTNEDRSGITLFWAITAAWSTLNQPWSYYQPYLYTRPTNEVKSS